MYQDNLSHPLEDNIFALSTPDLTSAICVFRLSGPLVVDIAHRLLQTPIDQPDRVYYRAFYAPQKVPDAAFDLIDKGIIFFKKGPHSFTGEDMVEIQLHGSRAVIKKMQLVLQDIPHLRMAQKGEFTRRAFMNSKMDILQAEALGDLIHADTDYQRRMALEGLDGALSGFIETLRQDIFSMIALSSAMIDFADDEIPPQTLKIIEDKLSLCKGKITEFLGQSCLISEAKQGLKIAIMGAPNAGKSSFINALLRRDAVIVSKQAGTTRDAISFTLDILGYPIKFIDTAGLRATDHEIESEGISRSLSVAQTADLIFFLQDPEQEISDYYHKLDPQKIIFIYTKNDLYPSADFAKNALIKRYFTTSSKTRDNIDQITEFSAAFFRYYYDKKGHFSLSEERYMTYLSKILEALDMAEGHLKQDDFFLFSEALSIALGTIEEMTCKIDFDTILEDIFSKFCIGK